MASRQAIGRRDRGPGVNVHEHQAKELLGSYGVPVPPGAVAYAPHQAVAGAAELGGERWVVKAQIHAGGRGKAGGVRVAGSLEEVGEIAAELLGSRLVTAQTGPGGALVGRVLVEPAAEIAARALPGARRRPRSAARLADRFDRWRSGGGGVRCGARPRDGRPRSGSPGLPVPEGRGCSRPERAAAQAGRGPHALALPLLRRDGCAPGRDQPAGRHRRREARRARRQALLRRQRRCPAPCDCGAARSRRGGPEGDRRLGARAQLHRAGRQRRLHRQRRRSCDGDDGRDRAPRRPTRRTSSTSVAARRRRRSRTPSGSCSPIRT